MTELKEVFEQVAQDEAEKGEHCAREHAQKHGPLAAHHRASRRTRRSHNVLFVPQQFSIGRLRFCGSLGENHKVVVRNLWRRVRLEATEQVLGRANWESFEQVKVFKAHAVPQGLCANLIIALKLLANQQEDGDGLLQNIVKNLGKESRKGLTDGLREFIQVDNMSAPLMWNRYAEARVHFKNENRKCQKVARM